MAIGRCVWEYIKAEIIDKREGSEWYAEVSYDHKPHDWKDATTSAPKTCTVCGATTGTKLSTYYYYSPAKTEDTPGSPKAGDPGVLLYAGLALASLTGLACTAKKRH